MNPRWSHPHTRFRDLLLRVRGDTPSNAQAPTSRKRTLPNEGDDGRMRLELRLGLRPAGHRTCRSGGGSGRSPFATTSTQSTPASERSQPFGPLSLSRHAPAGCEPPTLVRSLTTRGSVAFAGQRRLAPTRGRPARLARGLGRPGCALVERGLIARRCHRHLPEHHVLDRRAGHRLRPRLAATRDPHVAAKPPESAVTFRVGRGRAGTARSTRPSAASNRVSGPSARRWPPRPVPAGASWRPPVRSLRRRWPRR